MGFKFLLKKADMIDFISPSTGEKLSIKNNSFISEKGESFPIINGVPRFVEQNNYAQAFGLQWKTYAKTQLDSYSKTTISKDRVERCLGFSLENLKNKTLLEVGCGAGRFTELLVNPGALVHAVDLSVAVEVNKENIGEKENYTVAQANVYHLPFPKKSFDIVFCLGVIQHTPSSEKTINALWEMVKPGGMLVIDHYKWRLGYYSTLTPLYRMVLKEMEPRKSKKVVDKLVDFFFPLHWTLRNRPILNWLLHRISPLIVYMKQYPEQDRQFHYEWSKLDTYDQLTDYYKHLKTPEQIQKILLDLEGIDTNSIWVEKGGNGVEARCRKQE